MSLLPDKNRKPSDRRVIRSRAAIIGALNNLLLEGDIGDVTVNSVVNAAGISRSTFYLHFSNLDALIGAAITPLFNELASASVNDDNPDRLQRILEHFWLKRRLARFLLIGRRQNKMTEILKISYLEAIAQNRLGRERNSDDDEVTATFLAMGTIGILGEWLSGRLSVDFKSFTSALASYGRASDFNIG